MIFVEVLNYSFVFMTGGLISYYLLISLSALKRDDNIDYTAGKIRKFAVIVFAHEKKQLLSSLLYSVSGLVYLKNKYDVIVIADSYANDIVQTAEKMGAKVMVPPIGTRKRHKKNILPWAFESLLQENKSYDAFVLFDSDGLVSGNYLEVMNYYLEQGNEVVQCSYSNLYSPKNWVDKISEVNFIIDRVVYPRGRKVLGMGTALQSNGICFSTALLREIPWKIDKQSNITEYGLDLKLDGIDIAFASSAVVFTKIPTTHSGKGESNYFSNPNAGHFHLIRKYISRFLRGRVNRNSVKYIDLLFGLIIPQFSNLVLFVISMAIIDGMLWGVGWISLSALLLWVLLIGIVLINVSVALIVAGGKQKFLKQIMMYIPVNIYIKVKRFFQRNGKNEKSIVAPDDGNDKYVTVSDDNQPVQQ